MIGRTGSPSGCKSFVRVGLLHRLPSGVTLEYAHLINRLGYEHDVLLTSSKDPSFPILRGALQNYLAKSIIHQFAPVQVREARMLVKRIVQDPEGWKGALQM